MIFTFIISVFASENYIEITRDNQKEYLGGKLPILIKFYSPSCHYCQEMAEDFEKASLYFSDVLFGGVNCANEPEICIEQGGSGTPVIKLYRKGQNNGIEYEGNQLADNFIDFIEENTLCRSFRPPKALKILNPFSFDSFITKSRCAFVDFYFPPESILENYIKSIAEAFAVEENISFGALNCDLFSEFCNESSVSQRILYLNGKPIFIKANIKNNKEAEIEGVEYENEYEYDDEETGKIKIRDLINKNCGTERDINGLLVDTAGTVDEANKIVETEFVEKYYLFKTSGKNEKDFGFDIVIDKLKKIKGTVFYVNVLERIKKNGIEKLEDDAKKMKEMIENKKGSPKVLDGMKKRLNVMNLFIRENSSFINKNDEI